MDDRPDHTSPLRPQRVRYRIWNVRGPERRGSKRACRDLLHGAERHRMVREHSLHRPPVHQSELVRDLPSRNGVLPWGNGLLDELQLQRDVL